MAFARDERIRTAERARVGALVGGTEGLRWKCHTTVEKYHGTTPQLLAGELTPHEVLEVPGNLLLYGGGDIIWAGLKKLLSTGSAKFQFFDNVHASILLGDSTAAVVATQTDLQASSGAIHRWVQAMDATYPVHTTGASTAANEQIQFKATVSTANANFTNGIREWGVGNAITQAKPFTGRLLNRKVQNLGVKTSAGVWAITLTLSVA